MNPISKKEILDTLRTLDVAPGDLVFCHTSLRSFGAPLENGAKGLIEALLEAVSPGGAVAAPTHGRPPSDGPFDPATAPMWDAMGGFPRALLAWPGARRSLHPTHSDVAAGERSPSACSRSAMPLSTKARFTLMPVSRVKASTRGWISSGWRWE